jgi:hypothetical protein
MHIFLAVAERDVLVEFSRVPSGAQNRGRFPGMRSVREANITQFLPKIPAIKGPSSRNFG